MTETTETKECTYCDGDGYITRVYANGELMTTRCPGCNPAPRKTPFHTPHDFRGINRYNLPRSTTKRSR